MSAKQFLSIVFLTTFTFIKTEPVSFKNVTLWRFDDKIEMINASESLKENLPEFFIPSLAVKGKISVLYENSVKDIDNVMELYFEDNGIEEIQSGAFKNLSSLGTLVVNRSNLTTIKEGVFDDLPVKQLQVSFSLISTIPIGAFRNLPRLEKLILWHNKLEILEEGIFDNLTNLEILNLSDNEISTLPRNIFRNLPNIKYIILKRNKIEHIPVEALEHLPIYYLDLSGNSISTLSESFFDNLPQLRAILLSKNRLTSISKGIFNNRSLHDVELANNEISHIDSEAFDDMPNLSVVDFNGNKLSNYDIKWFNNSPNIYRLFLSNNLIEEIPDDPFRNIYNNRSRWIRLDGNRIKKISSDTFKGIKEFDYLNLSYNELEEWSRDFISVVERIGFLNLAHNKIACPRDDLDEIFMADFTDVSGNFLDEDCLKKIEEWLDRNRSKIVCARNSCFPF